MRFKIGVPLATTATIVTLFSSSCTHPQSTIESLSVQNATIIRVPSQPDNLSEIDSICSGYSIIPLSTPDRSVIGAVDGLAVSPDGFVVWDTHQRKSVMSFSRDGVFRFSIGRPGRGPGEYVQPDDVLIVDSTVIVLDCFGHKFLKYDLKGTHVSDIPFDMNLRRFQVDEGSGSYFVVTGKNRSDNLSDCEVARLDSEGKLESLALKNRFSMNYSAGAMLSCFNGAVFYHKPLGDRIVSFDKNGNPQVVYVLDFGSKGLPDGYEMECRGDYERFCKSFGDTKSYSFFSGSFQIVSRFVLFGVVNKGINSVCVHDMRESKTYLFDASLLSSSIESKDVSSLLIMAMSRSLAAVDNTLYCLLDPSISSLLGIGQHDSPSVLELDFAL